MQIMENLEVCVFVIYLYIYAAPALGQDLCLHKTEVVCSFMIVRNMGKKQLKTTTHNTDKCQLEFYFPKPCSDGYWN